MIQWEYHVMTWNGQIIEREALDLESQLNALGQEGWELINVVPQIAGFNGDVTTDFNQLIFKRKAE
ncbi:DUF4177 domain-containing protein [Aquibacillus halophilus]|uniref:DUF4177 domain-containing protein n=1 Tax=Aquibacillus halophilus TaxID=930132 RepID=A0A6A8DQ31_9BACI|nr:DUF4177 domain-containing protein [Aquibacillus halophilus]MRH43342.1 DUF4177 domain-containing protein [Aquibacillus halophilus]